MAPDHLLRQAEDLAERAHLVLEEKAHRLDELEAELLGKAADIVVELDVRARAGVTVAGLDHIGIERSLREEPHIARDRLRRFLEDIDEAVPDAAALLLRLDDSREIAEELAARVDDAEVDVEVIAEGRLDEVALVLPQQSVVDEDADELLADRLREERGDDRAVDAARKPADHLRVADAGLDARALGVDEVRHPPRSRAAAGLEQEVGEHVAALRGVGHLGVELDAIEAARAVAHRRERTGARAREHLESGGHLGDLVAVAHPNGGVRVDAGEQVRRLLHIDLRAAELAVACALDLAAEEVAHQLHAVADAEDRDAEREDRGVAGRRPLLEDARGTAREDDALRGKALDLADRDRGRDKQAEHAAFTNAARDQLRGLASKVKDEDRFGAGWWRVDHGGGQNVAPLVLTRPRRNPQ